MKISGRVDFTFKKTCDLFDGRHRGVRICGVSGIHAKRWLMKNVINAAIGVSKQQMMVTF